ncbi:hypothetical protein H072_5449 [Dactylellina haptotyla CBS 200.50]|uniref:Methyltransferase domain-containing protein n=1 Tax=Dactylellina haptotyla (strain CBS 200.50) TaxID=1284197 RepID=S8ACK4_DACHA|nr:hypothetical protein H072_5449 [Dactylellina haptotyla CBS 200.50]
MPRLSIEVLRSFSNRRPLVPLLLRQARSVGQAYSEYRWLREFVLSLPQFKNSPYNRYQYLKLLCRRRALGVPLQYLLKTQPFGEVDILCAKGALIPRPETEETVFRVFEGLQAQISSKNIPRPEKQLRVLDLCTGPGSISLLAANLLQKSNLPAGFRILGVDVSEKALKLAQRSLEYNVTKNSLQKTTREHVGFLKGDLLTSNRTQLYEKISSFFGLKDDKTLGIVISNPPYISPTGYWKETARSVRLFEPKLALVPLATHNLVSEYQEDLFYPIVEDVAQYFQAKALVLETGGGEQSERVQAMLKTKGWETSIWTDFAGIQRNVVAWQKNSEWKWLREPENDFPVYQFNPEICQNIVQPFTESQVDRAELFTCELCKKQEEDIARANEERAKAEIEAEALLERTR